MTDTDEVIQGLGSLFAALLILTIAVTLQLTLILTPLMAFNHAAPIDYYDRCDLSGWECLQP